VVAVVAVLVAEAAQINQAAAALVVDRMRIGYLRLLI